MRPDADAASEPAPTTERARPRPGGVPSVAELLRPESLFFVGPEAIGADPALHEALAAKIAAAPDPARRLEHLHYLLGLMHDARTTDEGRFLREVFLPWVAVRNRTRPHAARVYREMARLAEFTPGTADEAAHVVNVYRNAVSDLFDPYLTLIVACYQVLQGTFGGVVGANLAQGERNKVEYVAARMRERRETTDLLAGYDPIVRNAVSHAGSEGVVYEAGTVLFRNIKRASPPDVETARWTHDELYTRTLALVDFAASVDAAVEVFGMDCSARFVQDFDTLSQLVTLAFTPQQRARLRSALEADVAALRDDASQPLEARIEALSRMLFHNCAIRGIPVDRVTYRHADQSLFVDIPVHPLGVSDDDLMTRAMELIRYAVLARSLFGTLFARYHVREHDKAAGTTQMTVELAGEALDDYAEERAGLVDLLAEGRFALNGGPLRVEMDFAALAGAEDRALTGRLPRRPRG